jgi:hypothetical protein
MEMHLLPALFLGVYTLQQPYQESQKGPPTLASPETSQAFPLYRKEDNIGPAI